MKANRIGLLSAAALAGLVCMGSVGNANAYFTTYVTAKGGYSVSWYHEEEMHEEFTNWCKYITIASKEGSIPVFVRAKAFAGSTYTLSYEGSGWTYNQADGYYYYDTPLSGGATTNELLVHIDDIPVTPKTETNFNVVVVYETIPATYDDSGNATDPMTADWSQTLTSSAQEEAVQ